VLNEFYRVAFRKNVYRSIDELQADLDVWVRASYSTRYRKAKASKGLTGSFGDRSWPRKTII
jgi:hypothetical protein